MRVLLLMPTTTYRADDFLAAAEKLGVEVVLGSDRCPVLDEMGMVVTTRDSLVLDFRDPEASAKTIVEYSRAKRIDGVVPTDDATTVVAAAASGFLGLPHNDLEGALASRDKLAARTLFAAAGVRQARFCEIAATARPEDAAARAARDPGFPCVIKPRMLSASRGVMRCDDAGDFAQKFARLVRLLRDPEVKGRGGALAESVLVESFVPGAEVALEGLLTSGELEVLALFDKPDPLDGPFFEETLYVQPSRLPRAVQDDVLAQTKRACAALGLRSGPVHAELRIAPGGAHVLEVAARSIGGLCSRTLRFGSGMSLEEVLVRASLSGATRLPTPPKRAGASGVLMLPIPHSGVFRGVDGVEEARALPGVEEVTITAVEGRELQALPEGASYLGFVFAKGDDPAAVQRTLRDAQARLRVHIASTLATVT
ncbi:MAG TPA: ATP-grasp domain-containing protein [bacterium]|nr:ATP-grasp domain-containing protein [bacterium]